MKYCGCHRCRLNGEINPHEQFDIYLAQREDEKRKEFETVIGGVFSASELNTMESEFRAPDYSHAIIANRINFWYGLGGLI